MEDYHQVTITDQALQETVNLSERFLPNKFFPDKAIGLLDEAASRIKVANVRDIYGKKIKKIKEIQIETTNENFILVSSSLSERCPCLFYVFLHYLSINSLYPFCFLKVEP